MKRAVVVGASSGIGREVALLLRERGWTVGVAARREELLSDFELTAQIDVTAADAGQRLLNLVERLGGMDLYFHASGVGHQNRELHEEIEMQTVDTNGMGLPAWWALPIDIWQSMAEGISLSSRALLAPRAWGLLPAIRLQKLCRIPTSRL